MTIQRGIIYGTLVGAALIAYFWAFAWRDAGLSAVDYDAIAKELLALVFIALLIERAVEVYVGPNTGTRKARLESQCAALNATIAELTAQREPLIVPAATDDTAKKQLAAINKSLDAARAQLEATTADIAKANQETQRKALSISIPLSLFVALVGVRAIGSLMPEAEIAEMAKQGDQLKWFTVADVLITAGLLAGGADGIHKIVERLLAFFKKPEEKPVQQPEQQSVG